MSSVRKIIAAIAVPILVSGSVASTLTKADAQSRAFPAKVGVPIKVDQFSIELQGCEKQAASYITCHFKITNLGGDRTLRMEGTGSRMIDLEGNQIPGHLAELGAGSNWYVTNTFISGVPMRGSITFGGVGASVHQVALIEVGISADSQFKLQYRNVPLKDKEN